MGRLSMVTAGAPRLVRGLPRGGSLSEPEWAVRHRWIGNLLWLAVPAVVGLGLLRGAPWRHLALDAALIGVAAGVARWAPWRRAGRSAAAALGLSGASAVVVHISGGSIEAHFLFFVLVAVLSLYQDWVPFLVALGFVLLHHGVVGTMSPADVYAHPAARSSPWTWAGIHAGFVLAAATANVIAWRRSEEAARAAQESYRRLEEREARFRTQFADAAVGQVMAAPDGTILAGNRKYLEIIGYSEADLPLLDIESLTHPGDREESRAQIGRLLAGEIPSFDIEKRVLRGDGTVAHVLNSVSLVRGDDGSPAFLTAIVQDLTGRLEAEEARRRAEARFGYLVDAAPVAVVEYDLGGRVCSWNPEAERMFGWTAEEVRGLPSPIVPDRLREEFEGMLSEAGRRERFVLETSRRRRDGSEVEVSISGGPVLDDEGRVIGALSLLTDIGARRRLEEELRQAQRMEAVGRLAGGVAHDFNNLLTVITGYSDLALYDLDRGRTFDLAGYLQPVRHAADQAARLTGQLLTFSRRQPTSAAPVDVPRLVRSMQEMLGRLLGDNVSLETHLPGPGAPAVVMADRSQLEQVILNLAVNARDSMPAGGTVRIEVATGGDGPAGSDWVTLAVVDDGEGMDEATRMRVFEPFFTTKRPGAGTGLGLSTVYGIAESAGGSVSVASEPGRGSAFTVVLPAVAAAEEPEDTEEEPDFLADGETILLVEDQRQVRSLARAALERHGYTVLEARDGGEALSLLGRHGGRVDLLLSDVCLPDQRGPELAAFVSAARAGIKVLFISGFAPELRDEPGVELLDKPYTSAQLLRRVRRLLDPAGDPDRTPAVSSS